MPSGVHMLCINLQRCLERVISVGWTDCRNVPLGISLIDEMLVQVTSLKQANTQISSATKAQGNVCGCTKFGPLTV